MSVSVLVRFLCCCDKTLPKTTWVGEGYTWLTGYSPLTKEVNANARALLIGLVSGLLCVLFYFVLRQSYCIPGWPGTHCVDQGSLPVLGSKACATTTPES